MPEKFRAPLLVAFAIAIASCAISIMYVFISGDGGGGDMQVLLQVQAAAIPLALIVFVTELAIQDSGSRLAAVWRAIPAWLVLALLLFNLLVAIGELSLFLRARLTEHPIRWFEHAPLLCVVSCSLAVSALYARAYPAANGAASAVKRW